MKGFGTPIYLGSGYPFKIDPPRVTSEPPTNWTAFAQRDPVGSYRRTFELPKNWDGRRVFIHFDGVDSAFYLWVNGARVGFSKDSRTPAEFDLTDFVQPGANQIAVRSLSLVGRQLSRRPGHVAHERDFPAGLSLLDRRRAHPRFRRADGFGFQLSATRRCKSNRNSRQKIFHCRTGQCARNFLMRTEIRFSQTN